MIKIFWHIYMINHWVDIVREQLRILRDSGLYDECAEITIGCIGTPKEELFLRSHIIAQNAKLKIGVCSPIPMEFEYITLQLIENDDSDYIGFYFHTKGVTRPKDVMQPKERAYLNDMMIGHWRHHVELIRTGYDIASLNYLSIPNRFSGNYFWFHRNRLNRLPELKSIDHSDRFGAERWIYMKKQ